MITLRKMAIKDCNAGMVRLMANSQKGWTVEGSGVGLTPDGF